MAAYLVLDIEVTDPAGYQEYKELARPVVERFGGRYLVRGGAYEMLEGDWQPERLVIVEFPSVEEAKRFYDSDEYAPLKKIRLKTTISRTILIQGV